MFRDAHLILCVKEGLTIALLLEAAAAAQQVFGVLLRGVWAWGLCGLSSVLCQALALAALSCASERCRLLRIPKLSLN